MRLVLLIAAVTSSSSTAQPSVTCDFIVRGQKPSSLPTLQAAVDAAALSLHATTICIAPGSYTCAELAAPTASSTLIAAALAPTTIRAEPGGRVALDCESAGRALSVVGAALDVTLVDLDVRRGLAEHGAAVAVAGIGATLRVVGCTFRDSAATCSVEGRTVANSTSVAPPPFRGADPRRPPTGRRPASVHGGQSGKGTSSGSGLGYPWFGPTGSLRNGYQAEHRTSGCSAASDARGWVAQLLDAPAMPVVGGGGALSISGAFATVVVLHSNFSNVSSAGYGGAILATDVATIDVTGCSFTHASAPFLGGGVAVLASGNGSSEVHIAASRFVDVDGGGGGGGGVGGLYQGAQIQGIRWSISGSTFVRCTGGAGNAIVGGGGGVGLAATATGDLSHISVEVRDSTFEHCVGGSSNIVAGGAGGVGIAVLSTNGTVANVSVAVHGRSRVAECSGGALNLVAGGAGGIGVAAVSGGIIDGAVVQTNVSNVGATVTDTEIYGCVGGRASLYSGGAGGIGVAIMSTGPMFGTFIDIAYVDVSDCVGGELSYAGGAGGVGAALVSPYAGAYGTRIRAAESNVSRCEGGRNNHGDHFGYVQWNPQTGGAGGIGLAVNTFWSANDASLIVSSSRVVNCSGGTNNTEGGAGGIGVVLRVSGGNIIGFVADVATSLVENCHGGSRNDKGGGAGGVGFTIVTYGAFDDPNPATIGIVSDVQITLRGSNISNCTGGSNNEFVGGGGGLGVRVQSGTVASNITVVADRVRVVGCVGGNYNYIKGGGGGGIGLVMTTAFGMHENIYLGVRNQSFIANCSGGSHNNLPYADFGIGYAADPNGIQASGGAGGVGLVLVGSPQPTSIHLGTANNITVYVEDSIVQNCIGGDYNAVSGGAGGIGLGILLPNEVRNSSVIVRGTDVSDCSGGNSNKMGGAGGVGFAVWMRDIGYPKPQSEMLPFNKVVVDNSTILRCSGGSNNTRLGGAGGIGAAWFTDKGFATDALVRVTHSRIELCVGGHNNTLTSGAGGVGLSLQCRLGKSIGTSLVIRDTTIRACEADEGGGAALFIRSPEATTTNSFTLHNVVLEDNVANVGGGGAVRALLIPSLPNLVWPSVYAAGESRGMGFFRWDYNGTPVPLYRHWTHLSELAMYNCTLRGNQASGESGVGGALWAANGQTRIEGCIIDSNMAQRAGGAIYLESNSALGDEGEPDTDTEALALTGPIYPPWAIDYQPFQPAFQVSPHFNSVLRGGAALSVVGGTHFFNNTGLSDATRGLLIFGTDRVDITFDASISVEMTSTLVLANEEQVVVTNGNKIALGEKEQWRCPEGSRVANLSTGRSAQLMPQWFPTTDRNGIHIEQIAAGFGWLSNYLMRCTACAAGSSGSGGWECPPCAVDHVSFTNSSQCTRCGPGEVTSDGKVCTLCPDGAFENEDSVCEFCPRGSVSSDRVSCQRCKWYQVSGTYRRTCVAANFTWLFWSFGGIASLVAAAIGTITTMSVARAIGRETSIHRAARKQQWLLTAQLSAEARERAVQQWGSAAMRVCAMCRARRARRHSPFAPGRDMRSPIRIALDTGHRMGYKLNITRLLASKLRAVPRRNDPFGDRERVEPLLLQQEGGTPSGGDASLQMDMMFAPTRSRSKKWRASEEVTDAGGEGIPSNEEEAAWRDCVLHLMNSQRGDVSTFERFDRSHLSNLPARAGLWCRCSRFCAWCASDSSASHSRSLALQCLRRALGDASTPIDVLWPIVCSCLDSAGAATWRLILPPPNASAKISRAWRNSLARQNAALPAARDGRGGESGVWLRAEHVAAALATRRYTTGGTGANVVHTLVDAHVADLVDAEACAACIRSALRSGGRDLRHALDADGRSPASVVVASAKHRSGSFLLFL